MTKRTLLCMGVLIMALIFTGCVNATAKPLVGTWVSQDAQVGPYGAAVRFYDDGTVSFGLEGTGVMSLEEVEGMLDSIKSLVKLTYSVEEGQIKITANAIMGAAQKSILVDYALDGDKLTIGDTVYQKAG